MKVYLAKGYGVEASLVINPRAVETERDPEVLPAAIRGAQVRISGTDNDEIVLQGRIEEIRALVAGITRALATIEEQEAGQ